ncbi:uncharacterized protein [Diadema antillarum]|uniref:uncharacterized protein n=1 Tax=Diadema antillarum TaxID=105358 RepID=UPI003A8A9B53
MECPCLDASGERREAHERWSNPLKECETCRCSSNSIVCYPTANCTTSTTTPVITTAAPTTTPLLPPEDCYSVLGLENHVHGITLSASTSQTLRPASMARLNNAFAAWVPTSDDTNVWLQVDFSVPTRVTGIDTQGFHTEWVSRFHLEYFRDEDGDVGTAVLNAHGRPMLFKANSDGDSIVSNVIPDMPYVDAIRILPVVDAQTNWIALRIELRGCQEIISVPTTTGPPSTPQVTTRPATTPPATEATTFQETTEPARTTTTISSTTTRGVCEEPMFELGVLVSTNGDQESNIFQVSGVPAAYDPANPPAVSSLNTAYFQFTKPVTVRRVLIGQADGGDAPESLLIRLLNPATNSFFVDANNSPIAAEPIAVVGGSIELPETLFPVSSLTLAVVQASRTPLSLTADFLGCEKEVTTVETTTVTRTSATTSETEPTTRTGIVVTTTKTTTGPGTVTKVTTSSTTSIEGECRDDMDDLNVVSSINNVPREEVDTLTFSGIPESYDNTQPLVPSIANSFTVIFNRPVIVNVLPVAADSGSVPQFDVIVREEDGTPFTDVNGTPLASQQIPLVNGELNLPDTLPPVTGLLVIVVASDQPTFNVNAGFLGCIPEHTTLPTEPRQTTTSLPPTTHIPSSTPTLPIVTTKIPEISTVRTTELPTSRVATTLPTTVPVQETTAFARTTTAAQPTTVSATTTVPLSTTLPKSTVITTLHQTSKLPEVTTSKLPEITTSIHPEVTTTKLPEVTTSVPETTTQIPHSTVTLPLSTATIPRVSTSHILEKTTLPVSTTELLKTTSLPESTTALPKTTSLLKSTTAILETTSPVETTSLFSTKTVLPTAPTTTPTFKPVTSERTPAVTSQLATTLLSSILTRTTSAPSVTTRPAEPTTTTIAEITTKGQCEDPMTSLGVEVNIGTRRSSFDVSEVPETYDSTASFSFASPNVVVVEFSEFVIVRRVVITSASEPQQSLSAVRFLVRDTTFNPFVDADNNQVAVEPISLEGDRLELPSSLPALRDLVLIVAQADESALSLNAEFFGCIEEVTVVETTTAVRTPVPTTTQAPETTKTELLTTTKTITTSGTTRTVETTTVPTVPATTTAAPSSEIYTERTTIVTTPITECEIDGTVLQTNESLQDPNDNCTVFRCLDNGLFSRTDYVCEMPCKTTYPPGCCDGCCKRATIHISLYLIIT